MEGSYGGTGREVGLGSRCEIHRESIKSKTTITTKKLNQTRTKKHIYGAAPVSTSPVLQLRAYTIMPVCLSLFLHHEFQAGQGHIVRPSLKGQTYKQQFASQLSGIGVATAPLQRSLFLQPVETTTGHMQRAENHQEPWPRGYLSITAPIHICGSGNTTEEENRRL